MKRNAMRYDITGEIGSEVPDIKSDMPVDEKTTKRMYVHKTTINITV